MTNKNKKRSVGFYFMLNSNKSIGVYKKLLALIQATSDKGYNTNITQLQVGKFSPFLLAFKLALAHESIIFVRSLSSSNFYLIFSFMIARLRGKKIIIEVPTPNKTAIREIFDSSSRYWRKFRNIFLLTLAGPIPYWFTNRIIIYAEESGWFSLGCKSKQLKIGNGVDLNQIPIRGIKPDWPSNSIRLIGVASINYWHGYDRIIRGIKCYKDIGGQKDIIFTIIGDGPEVNNLVNLAKKLNISDKIIFTGILTGGDLIKHYEKSHIAVGSIALYRKGLTESSELKAREYTAVGIPFFATGEDPDFTEKNTFRIKLKNENEIESIVKVFVNINELNLNIASETIRQHAVKYLSYKVKIDSIFKDI